MSKKFTSSDNIFDAELVKTNKVLEHVQDYTVNINKNKYKNENPNLSEQEIIDKILKDKKDDIYKMSQNMIHQFNFKNVENVKKVNDLNIIKSFKKSGFTKQIETVEKYTPTVKSVTPFFKEFINYDQEISGKQSTPEMILKKSVDLSDKISQSFLGMNPIMSQEHAMKAAEKISKAEKFVIFDFETLAGQNQDNIKTFGGITEFAFGTYNKSVKDGVEKLIPSKTYSSIVGIDRNTSEKFLNKYERLKNNKEAIPDDVMVAVKALGKMGHEATSIVKEEGYDSIYNFKSYASDDDIGINSIENIKKGIEIYDNIYRQQQMARNEEGLLEVEKLFVDGLKDASENPLVGYNIIKADIPWAKQQIEMLSPEGKRYVQQTLGTSSFNPKQENVIDLLGLIDTREKLGYSTLDFYSPEGGSVESTLGKRKTYRQQETLFGHIISNPEYQKKYGISTEDLTAHSAIDDVETLARAFSIKEFRDTLTEDILDSDKPLSEKLDIENQVFLNTKTRTFGKFYQDGPLSFTYDKESGNIKTFMGQEIKSDGSIIPQFSDHGRKKDSLIKIEGVHNLKTTDKFRNQLKNIMPEYSQEDLYALEISNYTELKDHKGSQKNTVLIFNTMVELEAHLDSYVQAGERNKETGKMELVKGKKKEILDKYYTKYEFENTLEANKPLNYVEKKISSFDELLKDSDRKISQSSTDRLISDMGYKRYNSIKKVFNEINGMSGESLKTLNDLQGYVSNNKDSTYPVLKKHLGFFDYNTKQHVAYDETIDNTLHSLNEIRNVAPIFETVNRYIDEKEVENKEEAFKYLTRQTMSEIENLRKSDNELISSLFKDSTKEAYAKDLNYIEIDISKIIENREKDILSTSKSKAANQYLKIGLGHNDEYRLVSGLLEHTGDDRNLKPYDRSAKALSSLDKVIKYLSEDEVYSKYIDLEDFYSDDDHKKFTYKNPEIVSKKLIESLSKIKEDKGMTYGIKNIPGSEVKDLDREGILKAVNEISRLNQGFDNFLEKSLSNMPTTIDADSITRDKHRLSLESKRIADKILFGDKTQKELLSSLSEYGYSEEHISFMSDNLSKTRDSVSETIATMISEGSKIGMDFIHDKEGNFFIDYDGETIPLTNLPRINERDGNIVTSIGNMDVVLSSSIISNINQTAQKPEMYVSTTIEAAMNKVYNPAYSFRKRQENPDDIIQSIRLYNRRLGEELREAPAITRNDLSERSRMWEVDYTEMLDKLPYFYSKGYLDDVEWADKEFVDLVLKNENFDAYQMMGSDREIVAKNVELAAYALYDISQDPSTPTPELRDKNLQRLFSNFSINVPEKSLSENVGQFGHTGFTVGTTRGDNIQRPVPYQKAASKEFRRSYLKEQIEKAGKSEADMSLGSLFITDLQDKARDKPIRGLRESLEMDVKIKKANISTIDMRTLLIDEMLDRAEDPSKAGSNNLQDLLTNEDKKIFNRLLATELFEDGVMVDQSLFSMFGHSEQQTINLNKDLILSGESIEEIADLMPSFVETETGEVQFEYAKGRFIDGKEKNFLTLAGFGEDAEEAYGSVFDKGMLTFEYRSKTGDIKVTEEEVQSYINNVLLKEKPDLTMSEVQNELREVYDFKAVMSNIEKQTYFKMFLDGGEKVMASAPAFGIGELNEDVAEYFENHKDERVRNLSGVVMDLEYFDELIGESFEATDSFKSEEELREAIYQEQTAAMREFFGDGVTEGMLGEAGISMAGPSGSPKHNNFWMDFEKSVHFLVSDIMEKEGLSEEEAVEFVMLELQDKDILQISGAYYKDGKIVLPSDPNKDKDTIDYVDRGKMRALLEERGLVDEDGYVGMRDSRTSASISYTAVSKAYDYDKSSRSRMRDVANRHEEERIQEIKEARQEQRGLREQIEKLEKIEDPTKEDEKNIETLIKQVSEIDDRVISLKSQLKRDRQAKEFFDRPAKIGNRELFTLRLNRANETAMEEFQQAIDDGKLDPETAKEMLGHMFSYEEREDGLRLTGIKEEYENESMLKNTIEALQYKAFNKYAATSLDDAIARDPEKYKHLKSLQESFAKRGIHADVRSAEEMYELANTYKAIQINADKKMTLEEIENQGFKKVGLLEMAVPLDNDVSYIKENETSFLTDNLVFDLGEEFEAETGRYIAVPKLERVSGEQSIKYEHQKSLIGLRKSYYEYQEAVDTGIQEDIDNKYLEVVRKVEQYQEAMSKDLTSKKGMMHQMSEIQLDNAFMGKTSSIVNIDLDTILDEEHGRDYSREVAQKLEESGIRLGKEDINFDDLNVATFKGKTLMEYSEEGTEIAASFLSKESFEELGYFDEGYLRKYADLKYADDEDYRWEDLVEEDLDKLRGEIEHSLRTEGLDAFTVRYPTIKTGSIIPAGVYMSDELHGSVVKITAPQQLAMEGDNDGDLVRSMIFRDKKGHDSLLNKLSDEQSVEFEEIAASRLYRSMSTDKEWQDRVIEGARKEFANAYDEGNLLSITGDSVLDDKVFSSFGVKKDMQSVKENYEDWLKIEADIIEKFDEVRDASDIDFEVMDEYLGLFDDDDPLKEEMFNTMAFHSNIVSSGREALNKYKKLSIGEANVPLYNIRQYAEIEAQEQGYGDEEFSNLMVLQVVADEAEQSVISSKKSLADYAFVNKTFREATNKAVYGNERDPMREWLEQNIDKEKLYKQIEVEDHRKTFDIFFEDLELSEDSTEEEIREAKVDKLLDIYSDTISSFDKEAFGKITALNRQGSSIVALSAEQIERGLSGVVDTDDGTNRLILDVLQEAYDISPLIGDSDSLSDIAGANFNVESNFFEDTDITSRYSYIDQGTLLREESTTGSMIMESLSNIHEGLSERFSDRDSKKIALGALGVAAATMTMGSILGDPTLNNKRQEPESYDYYDTALMDDDLNMYQTQDGGYVINMSGTSKQNSKQIQSAVASAMSGGTPLDINMTMNINDDTAQITEKYIQDMLASYM